MLTYDADRPEHRPTDASSWAWTFAALPVALADLGVDRDRRCALHIGAHEGEELPYYEASGYSRIGLVEPDPDKVKLIQGHLVTRGLRPPHRSVEVCGYAVVPTLLDQVWPGGKATFYRSSFTPMSGFAERADHPPTETFTVLTRPIQSLLERFRPSLLTIDTQGSELEMAIAAADWDAKNATSANQIEVMIVEAFVTRRNGKGKLRPKVKCAAPQALLDAELLARGWRRAMTWIYDDSLYRDCFYVRSGS